jgi:hypothetical protein
MLTFARRVKTPITVGGCELAPGTFGGGARRCIGLAFAQWEMKLAIAKILTMGELDLVDQTEVKPQRRGLVTGPNRPIQMVVKSQRPAKSRILQTSNI